MTTKIYLILKTCIFGDKKRISRVGLAENTDITLPEIGRNNRITNYILYICTFSRYQHQTQSTFNVRNNTVPYIRCILGEIRFMRNADKNMARKYACARKILNDVIREYDAMFSHTCDQTPVFRLMLPRDR